MATTSTATGLTGNTITNANTEKSYQSGSLGDITVGATYSLMREGLTMPALSGSLDFKTRTGRDVFETPDPAAHVPAGSGFFSLRGTLSASKTSPPAVVYGSLGYGYNFPRSNIAYTPQNRPPILIASYQPGANISASGGVPVALNYQLSLSWNVSVSKNYSATVNGRTASNSSDNSISFSMGGK